TLFRPTRPQPDSLSSGMPGSTSPSRPERDAPGRRLQKTTGAAAADRSMMVDTDRGCSIGPEMECHNRSADSTMAIHHAKRPHADKTQPDKQTARSPDREAH